MRTEAEIREAMELCKSCNPDSPTGIQNRDVTVEALRYALGMDDESSSPMTSTLADLIQDIRDNPDDHNIRQSETLNE